MPTRSRYALSAALLVLLAAPLLAARGDDTKRKSKNGHTEGEIAGVKIAIDYGRPVVGGREIWGALVPYDKVWRAGADEATTISFDKNVTIEGKPLAAGTYALFTLPAKDKWTVIFNKTADQWGAFKYDAAQDALRVDVSPAAHEATEQLTYAINAPKVVLTWEKTAVEFNVAAAK